MPGRPSEPRKTTVKAKRSALVSIFSYALLAAFAARPLPCAAGIIRQTTVQSASQKARQDALQGALFDASYSRDPAKVLAAIQAGADVNRVFGPNGASYGLPLADAVFRGLPVVRMMVEHGARVNGFDRHAARPSSILAACEAGFADIVRYLLHHGADIWQRDEDGNTAMLSAAPSNGAGVIVPIIYSCGGSVHDRNVYGETPLIRAAGNTSANCVPFLLAHGASLRDRDINGRTPLLTACYYASAATLRSLLAAGASVRDRDKNGDNALSVAVQTRQEEGPEMQVLQLLIRHGCRVNAVNKGDRSVLDEAFAPFGEPRKPAVLAYLRRHGAKYWMFPEPDPTRQTLSRADKMRKRRGNHWWREERGP